MERSPPFHRTASPNSPEMLANAMVFMYLNSVDAHDEVPERKSSQYAGAELVQAIADHLEETDLGEALREALAKWRHSPVDANRRVA